MMNDDRLIELSQAQLQRRGSPATSTSRPPRCESRRLPLRGSECGSREPA